MSNLSKRLEREPLAEVTAAYIDRVRLEKGTIAKSRAAMPSRGYEEVYGDGVLTADGREIISRYGKRWALLPEVHADRLALRMAEAKALQAAAAVTEPKAKPGEALTSVLCPSCQSIMGKSPVCPRCPKGKAGFKILCICTECGHEVYL